MASGDAMETNETLEF